MKGLTESDINAAAAALGCEPAAIKAVCEVEAPGGGFLPDGRPVILFERHKFHRFTSGRFAAELPDLSSARPGGYRGGAKEWERYERAAAKDRRAAMLSCSWGRFQVMGFNYAHCGYASVEEFVQAMHDSEGKQLMAFVELVDSFGLADELARKDWAGFAYGYNGPKFARNQYDVKLRQAYQRYAGPAGASSDREDLGEREVAGAASIPQPARVPSPSNDPPAQVTQDSRKAWWTSIFSTLGGGAGAVFALFERNERLLYLAAAIILVGLAGWLIRSIMLDYLRLKLNADPEKYNVK